MTVVEALSSTATTGLEFGRGTDNPTGGGLMAVLVKDIGSNPVKLQVEIDSDWVDTGNEWTENGGFAVQLPAGVKHRLTVSAAGPTVLLTPIDRASRGPSF